MNKVDIDGIETKVLIQHSWNLGGPPALKVPLKFCFICPNLEEFLKLEGKDYNKELIQKIPEVIGRLITIKIDKRVSVPWLNPPLGTKSLMHNSE